MSGATRDVTITVKIKNGKMDLGPLDISSFLKSMQTASAAAEALQKQLAGIQIPNIPAGVTSPGGGGANPPAGANGPPPSLHPSASAASDALEELAEQAKDLSAAIATLKGSLPGSSSGGPSGVSPVNSTDALTPDEQAMASMAGRLQRKRMDDQQAVADNDVANAVEATNKAKDAARKAAEEEAAATSKSAAAHQAYAQSSRAAALGAAEFAKGLVLIAASGDKNADSILRAVVQVQGYFNVVRGGMSAINAINDALKARASLKESGGASSTASAASGTAAALDALRASSVTLVGIFAGMAAVAALAARQLNVWAVEDDKAPAKLEQEYSAIRLRAANAAASRHVDQTIREVDSVQNIGEMGQTHKNLVRRGQTEAAIRAEQAGSTRDYAAKQEMRSRAERAQGLQENTDAARNDLETATRKQEAMKGAKEKLEADKKASKEAYESHVKKIEAGFRKLTGRSREQGELTGLESDDDVRAHNARQQQELNKAKADRAAQEEQEMRTEQQLQQQSLAIGEQRVEAAARLVTATREQVAAARENYEQDKQTVALAHQSLGAMSAGDRHILKQIEAKRKSGGKWEQWEIQKGLSAPVGTKLHDEALRQSEANDDSGLEMSPDVAASKKKLDEMEAVQAAEETGNMSIVESQTKSNETMAKVVEGLAKAISKQQEAAAEMLKLVEEWNRRIEDQIRIWTRRFK